MARTRRRKKNIYTTKPCTCCEEQLPLHCFSDSKIHANGKQPMCKECMREKIAEGKARNAALKEEKIIVASNDMAYELALHDHQRKEEALVGLINSMAKSSTIKVDVASSNVSAHKRKNGKIVVSWEI